ncbi:MAG TPA: DUF2232 domain-containing protein [Rhodospirillales bacterium]|nr:DUF2232 domain-containing protein [Rhodospirillales bacterium]
MWIALVGGGVSAIASMAVGAGIPGGLLFLYMAPLPLLLVGLSLGASTVLVAGFAGIMVSGLLGGVLSAGMYAIVNAFPAWLVTRQMLSKRIGLEGAEQWRSLGPAIAWLSVMAAVFLIAGSLTVGDGKLGAEAAVTAFLSDAINAISPDLTDDMRLVFVELLVPLYPGVVGASWVLMLVINAALAQKILRNAKRNIRPSPTLATLKLPHWTSWALVGGATTALLGAGELEYISRNLTIVLATPFFFLGLAVVHYAADHVAFSGSLLAFFYFVLLVLFVSGWALLVVGIGMIEQWAGLRVRFSGPSNISGDE